MSKIRLLALLIVLSGVCAAPARAQCRAADAGSATLIRSLTRITTATDSVTVQSRRQLAIPAVPASQVTLVTTKTVCSKALQAYAPEVARSDGIVPSSAAYVVKVGTTYVVYDPVERAGEFGLNVVMTSQYQVLSRFAH